jgi:hypothetical protein
MRGRTHLHINWVHLSVLLFCLVVWALVAAAGARVGGSYRVHRLFDHMTQAAAPLSRAHEV